MDTDETLEAFALADDRRAALGALIPGSAPHDARAVLLLQHEGRLPEAARALEAAIARHGRTQPLVALERRGLLLGWPADPKGAAGRLTNELGVSHHHERQVEGAPTALPTRLDPALVGRDALLERALSWRSDLGNVTPAAWDALAARGLEPDRRRALLGLLDRPDVPNLVDLVLADLGHRHSGGFGSLPIHRLLTAEQLAALARRDAQLLKSGPFVEAWLRSLQPGPDVAWEHDPLERRRHQRRLEDFVLGLAPSWNPLKVHVLWHGLDLDRREGVFDRERLVAYLQLPRNAGYVEPQWLKAREHVASFGADYRGLTLLPPVSGDEALVREHLAAHLLGQEDVRPFDTWVRRGWLEQLLAETKLLAGRGEPERWYALLGDPARVAALRERVDLELAPTNRAWLRAEDPVSVAVDVKNVRTLVVKVFEVDALNVALATGREPDTSLDLDGLVPGEERVLELDAPPLRRVRRTIDLPALTRAGTFVVELIGGGRASRALLRKGTLRYVERRSAAGHAFTILDEAGRALPDASLWLEGREHRADASGEVLVPYSTAPGRRQVVLRHGAVATLETFEHAGEAYGLEAGLHVEREALTRGRTATLVVRPTLRLAGAKVASSLLEEATLVVETVDGQGTPSARTTPVTLEAGRELAQDVAVPEDLRRLRVVLRGVVRAVTTGERVALEAERTWTLNGIDATAEVQGLHLSRTPDGWVVHLLGKAGEPRPGVPVSVWVRHRLVTDEVDASLQTDARGRVELGHLEEVTHVRATASGAAEASFALETEGALLPATLHGRAGEALRLPWPGALRDGPPPREAVALLERAAEGYRRDRLDALRVEAGQLVLTDLEPGDYDLRLKATDQRVTVRITAGPRVAGWIAGATRLLEAPPRAALAISRIDVEAEAVVVRLAGAGPGARVHVVAARFHPEATLRGALGAGSGPGPRAVELAPGLSAFVSGRDIGDEYRYVLDRRLQRRLPGVMLQRPGLLLNPWALRTTDTGVAHAAGGGGFGSSAKRGARRETVGALRAGAASGADGGHATLDFLADAPAVLLDLKPDAKGVVRVPRSALGRAATVRALALDEDGAVERVLVLPEPEVALREVRLVHGFDPQRHLAQRRTITTLPAGGTVELADAATSRVEVLGTLARVFDLLGTLSGRASDLEPFRFLLDWPSLTDAEQRARYSAHACHEVHLFLALKDAPFFQRVVRPYLANKRDKQVMDRLLLEQDVSAWREPWAWSRLNALERILVAGRIEGEGPLTARHVADLASLAPPDPAGDERRFRTALGGAALDPDGLGQELLSASAGSLSVFACADEAMPMVTRAGMAAPAPAPPMAALRMAAPSPGAGAGGALEKSKGGPSKKAMRRDKADDADAEECDAPMESAPEERERSREESDLAARASVRPLFRAPERTQELGESNYWRVRQEEQGPELVRPNPFWADHARHVAAGRRGPFVSAHVGHAAGSVTEVLLALAVLDLPFTAERATPTSDGPRLALRLPGASLVVQEDLREVGAPTAEAPRVLVSQAYFRQDDRWVHDPSGESRERPVTGELLTHVVYACQVVLTNPTSTPRRLEVLLQVPRGAIPVGDGFRTRGRQVELGGYQTHSLEYGFYFPAPGAFPHYPVHASLGEALVAAAEARTLTVVREPSTVDTTSWRWVSQQGTDEDVLRFLEGAVIERLDLSQLAWRMRERGMFARTLALLTRRHVYSRDLWAYGLLHGDAAAVATLLRHEDGYLRQAGPVLRAALLDVDPVERGWYEHREYLPLINARAHRLGGRRKVLNDRQAAQWRALLDVLSHEPRLDDDDRLAVVYHLLLQDRLDEALAWLERVDEAKVETRLQLDYLRCVAAFARGAPEEARATAQRHADHPVDRWRGLFRTVLAHLDEARGQVGGAAAETTDDAAERQGRLAATTPSFEVAVESRALVVTSRHLERARVRYFLMDVELLFSRQPFVQQQTRQFSFVAPNHAQDVALEPGGTTVVELPEPLRARNVVVEVEAAGQRRTQAHLAHALDVQVIEPYGQVRVGQQAGGAPLAAVYVKVYARTTAGAVEFYKDGYTDLRGRFDYASLSTDDLSRVERFALLVLSDAHGAVIREAGPPTR